MGFDLKSARLPTGLRATSLNSYATLCDELAGDRVVSVRQIPPNRRSVTGFLPSRKNGGMVAFESALERDLATVLEFDPGVDKYETQPVQLRYGAGGSRFGYPDFLVRYRADVGISPVLIDVKYRSEIFAKWASLKPRFVAARRHAKDHGWSYRLMTETEIRGPFLENAKFLLPYLRCEPDSTHASLLMYTLAAMETATPETLLHACYADPWNRAQLIPTLWCLLGQRSIGADLDEELTMRSMIWKLRND